MLEKARRECANVLSVRRDRSWLNRHSSCTINVYKLDAYADSVQTYTLGCLVSSPCELTVVNFPTIKLGIGNKPII